MHDSKSDADVSNAVTPNSATPNSTHVKDVGKYRIEVIREKCISAASCVAIAPETYQLDEEDIAYVADQKGDTPELQLLGAQSCPTAAIIITDTETGDQVWPR